MTQVTLVVTTAQQAFPVGTADTPYAFTITDPTGAVVVQQSESNPTATLVVNDFGDFIATVVKNGVAAHVAFNIPNPNINLNVPSAITVTLG